jgi:hypothetical protein
MINPKNTKSLNKSKLKNKVNYNIDKINKNKENLIIKSNEENAKIKVQKNTKAFLINNRINIKKKFDLKVIKSRYLELDNFTKYQNSLGLEISKNNISNDIFNNDLHLRDKKRGSYLINESNFNNKINKNKKTNAEDFLNELYKRNNFINVNTEYNGNNNFSSNDSKLKEINNPNNDNLNFNNTNTFFDIDNHNFVKKNKDNFIDIDNKDNNLISKNIGIIKLEKENENEIENLYTKNYDNNCMDNGSTKNINNNSRVFEYDNICKNNLINILEIKKMNDLKKTNNSNEPSILSRVANNKYKDLINDFFNEMM